MARIEYIKGSRIDLLGKDVKIGRNLEVGGNLHVHGTEIINATEIVYGDRETRGGRNLIIPLPNGDALVIRNANDTENRVRIDESGLMVINRLALANLTTDPSLLAGLLWFRRDLNRFYYSPDGVVKRYLANDNDINALNNTISSLNNQLNAHVNTNEGIHGLGAGEYIAKTSRPDQLPSWNDIPDKPSQFNPEPHGSRHNIGGSDEIPDLATLRSDFDTHASNPSAHHTKTTSRNEITDFWNSPFWDNIPDKPSQFPPEPHTHSRSAIVDFFSSPFWNNIPDKPSKYPPESHTHSRSEITDFFNSPFWNNIPDKPSEYPPEPHTHSRSEITDFFNSPFWNNIPDKPSVFPPENHADKHAPDGSDELKYLLLPVAIHDVSTSNKMTSLGTVTLTQGERVVGKIISGFGTIVFYPQDDILANITPIEMHDHLSNEPNIRDHDDNTYANIEGYYVPGYSVENIVKYDLGEIMNVFIRGLFNCNTSRLKFGIFTSSDGESWTRVGDWIGPSVDHYEYLAYASNVRYIEVRLINGTEKGESLVVGQSYVAIYSLEVFPSSIEGNYILKKVESTLTTDLRVYASQTPLEMKVLELMDFKIA